MARVGVVTDTTNCLPDELIKEYGIRTVPEGIVFGGKLYRDQVDLKPPEFWKMFKSSKTIPTTTPPAPGDFVTAFSDLAKLCDGIVCVLVSKVLTAATHEAAAVASSVVRESNPNLKIEIIDSKCSAGALGFLALEAARAAKAGKSLDDVVNVVNSMLPKVTYITVFESLKYLIKGGRAPKTAVIGDWLGVRPIIVNNKETGEVDPVGRERGKKKAMQKMVDMVTDYTEAGKPLHMMVHFTDNRADGEMLKKMVTARYACVELYVTDFTPVIGVHTGPSTSLSFYSE